MSQAVSPSLGNKVAKSVRDAGISWLKAAANASVERYKNQKIEKKQFKDKAVSKDNLEAQSLKNMVKRPIAIYQAHNLYFVLKALGYLPDAVIERINRQIGSPKGKDYPNADAHLRLIIGMNRKIRQPLNADHLLAFRQRFSAYVVSLQSPSVWQREHPLAKMGLAKLWSNSILKAVDWKDITINDADGGDMILRCYQAAKKSSPEKSTSSASANPVILYFHGGGFCIGNLDTHHELCYELCAKTGWQVVSVDYRLAPEFPAPAALTDCLAAYAWLYDHIEDFGGRTDGIIVAGDSAGGCLSALVAQQLSQSQHFDDQVKSAQEQSVEDDDLSTTIFRRIAKMSPPLAQLCLYPVTDTKTDYPSWTLYGKGLLLDYEDIVVFDSAYIQKSNLQRSDTLISPMAGDNSKLCPSFVVAAELDILRDEALAYADQLDNFGIAVQSHLVKGAPHGFLHLASVHRGIRQKTDAIIDEFIDFSCSQFSALSQNKQDK